MKKEIKFRKKFNWKKAAKSLARSIVITHNRMSGLLVGHKTQMLARKISKMN